MAEILPQVRGQEEAAEVKSWGILGLLGLNRWLLPIDEATRSPFMPYGLSGIMLGAAIVFFAFIGFDSISTHAEEARRPQRDVPIGILVSLGLCTLLYIVVAAVVTGMVPYPDIDIHAPIAAAFEPQAGARTAVAAVLAGPDCRRRPGRHDERAARAVLESGADIHGHVARRAVAEGFQHGSSPLPHAARGHHAHGRGDLRYGRLHADSGPGRNGQRRHAHGLRHGFAAVWVLRYQRPAAERPFRCPAIWLVAPAGMLINVTMTLFLSVATWIRLVGWLAVGLVIYFTYSLRHSHLAKHLMQEIRMPRKEVTGTKFDPEVVE